MKTIFNIARDSVSHYSKKDMTKESAKVMSQVIKTVETRGIKDRVDVRTKDLVTQDKQPMFIYKPSVFSSLQQTLFLQRVATNNFDYRGRLNLNTTNQTFEKKEIGLSNQLYEQSKIYRQFSTKISMSSNQVQKNGSKVVNSISNEKKSFAHENPKIYIGGDFEKLVTKSTIFVDKSLFIKEIMEDPKEAILITMPRRWGKSLNLDMLKRFLSVEEQSPEEKDLNRRLFTEAIKTNNEGIREELLIFKQTITQSDPEKISATRDVKALDLQGKYPVIHIDLKDCNGSSYEDVFSNVKSQVVKLYEKHGYLSKSKKPHSGDTSVGQKYSEYLGEIKNSCTSAIHFSLKNLSELLNKHFDKKVWILVDEYDSPLNFAFKKFGKTEYKVTDGKIEFKKGGDFEKIVELFRSIMSPALKSNEYLEKGVLTGVLSSAQSSMLSGLNNVKHYNLLSSKFTKYYGFNEEEVSTLIKHFYATSDSETTQLKDISNGYKYGNRDGVYNTWSTASFLNDKDEKNTEEAWTKSGGFDLVEDIILNNINDVQTYLNKLVSGESLDIKIKTDIEYEDLILGKIDTFMSTLLWTGYLTPTENNEVKIPNESIKKVIEIQIAKWVEKYVSEEDAKTIFSYLDYKDIFEEKLREAFEKTSFYDLNKEKDCHNIMNGMMMMLPANKYSFVSNREVGLGRPDAELYDKTKKKGYIFEYKYTKETDEAKTKIIGEEALVQIKKNKYDTNLRNTFELADKDIMHVAIIFQSKNPHVFVGYGI